MLRFSRFVRYAACQHHPLLRPLYSHSCTANVLICYCHVSCRGVRCWVGPRACCGTNSLVIAAERNIIANAEHIPCSSGAAAGVTHTEHSFTNAPFTVHDVAALPSAIAAAVVPSNTPHCQHYELAVHSSQHTASACSQHTVDTHSPLHSSHHTCHHTADARSQC